MFHDLNKTLFLKARESTHHDMQRLAHAQGTEEGIRGRVGLLDVYVNHMKARVHTNDPSFSDDRLPNCSFHVS